jgi:hypothetical protein
VIERGGDNAQIVNLVASYASTGGPGTVHSAAAKAGVVTMRRDVLTIDGGAWLEQGTFG